MKKLHKLRASLLLAALTCACHSPDRNASSADQMPAEGTAALAADPSTDPYARPGFHTAVVDGRLWVLREDSAELAEFLASGEPAKSVTLPGRGPGGVTLRGSSMEELEAYRCSKAGFYVQFVDGRLWVLRDGSEALSEYRSSGEPAKSVTMPGRGPGGVTLRSSDRETIEAYLQS